MAVNIPSVRCLRLINAGDPSLLAPVGTTVILGGYLSDAGGGDGGGGTFLAVHRDGSAGEEIKGEPMLPDHGLLFPTADPDILLLRQGTGNDSLDWRPAKFHELAPHAFAASTDEGERMTIVATSPTQAAWWGAVPDAATFSPCPGALMGAPAATAGGGVLDIQDLYKGVAGASNADAGPEALFDVYPFLKEGVFFRREDRDDWLTFPPSNPPNVPVPESTECGRGRPEPTVGPGPGVADIVNMSFHVAALQSAIERSEASETRSHGDITVAAHDYRLTRHLTVRKRREIHLPTAADPAQATFTLDRPGYPQNAVLMMIPSWQAFDGASETCADGAFCDEHVYGEPIPAARFELADDLEPVTAGGTTFPDSILLPIPFTTNLQAQLTPGREMFFRLGRTDPDSVEPDTSEWHEIAAAVAEGGGARASPSRRRSPDPSWRP